MTELGKNWEGEENQAAGKKPLERSDSGFLPAARDADQAPEEWVEDVETPRGAADGQASRGALETDEWEDEYLEDLPDDMADRASSHNDPVVDHEHPFPPPNLAARRRGTLSKKVRPRLPLSPQQKILILDTWQRSHLPARDFAALVDVSHHTLYAWKKRFEEFGPAGLVEGARGVKRGSKLPELTKRTILLLKQAHPDWGCERISDLLFRGPGLPASPAAVSRVLHEAGYEARETPTHPHEPPARRFERAKPNQLWQTDLFTFMLKRQNRRVYLVAFMDDHSRFIVSYGLHASQSSGLVIEVLRAGITSYGVPAEILTDNGSQYVTWRGKSAFTKELEKRGVKQIVAKPRRPQTLGKIERFWGTLWREYLEAAIHRDLGDARQRIGLFIDYYNFQRTHSGIDGLVPADRFFQAAPEVLKTLRERVAANALDLARHGAVKKPFYLTGQLDGKPFSVHREGDRVLLRQVGVEPSEIDLVAPPPDPSIPESPQPIPISPAPEEPEDSVQPLPAAICPDGSPVQNWSDLEPMPPGQSPLDEPSYPLDVRDARENTSAAGEEGDR